MTKTKQNFFSQNISSFFFVLAQQMNVKLHKFHKSNEEFEQNKKKHLERWQWSIKNNIIIISRKFATKLLLHFTYSKFSLKKL